MVIKSKNIASRIMTSSKPSRSNVRFERGLNFDLADSINKMLGHGFNYPARQQLAEQAEQQMRLRRAEQAARDARLKQAAKLATVSPKL